MSKKRWQSNLRIIAPNIQARVAGFEKDECVASCVLSISREDIQSREYTHIGIQWGDTEPIFSEVIVPPAESGRYSKENRHGRVVIHTELAKVEKTWSIESPNYGDASKGYHEVEFSRLVYQREFRPPRLLPITIEILGQDLQKLAYNFKFTVREVLDRRAAKFEDDLLFNLNLLQENVGNHNVYESDASREDYLKTLYVKWEILPPGEDETIERILSSLKSDDPRAKREITDRYNFLLSLEPENFIRGTNEFRRYFGAQFDDDLVVFENIEYGNAIYIMFEDWTELSQKTRIELLSSNADNFIRIPHIKTWKRKLRRIIQSEKEKRKLS